MNPKTSMEPQTAKGGVFSDLPDYERSLSVHDSMQTSPCRLIAAAVNHRLGDVFEFKETSCAPL